MRPIPVRTRTLLAAVTVGLILLGVFSSSHAGPRPQTNISGLRIAVIEHTPYHDEVIGGVVTALHDAGANYDVYRNGLNWGFDKILSDVHPDPPIPQRELVTALNEGKYDVLVLTTGDKKFWPGEDPLLTAMRRSTSTHIICLIHEIESYGMPQDLEMIANYAAEERLTLLTLGRHSARLLESKLTRWAWERGEPMWENVDVVHFAPVFRMPASAKPEAPVIPRSNTPRGGPPSRAAILGRIHQSSRDYERILSDLVAVMKDDPKPWGYKLVPYTSRQLVELAERAPDEPHPTHRFVPREHADPPPFTLHLIGKDDGLVPIPLELRDPGHPVVRIHSNLDYREFYDLLGEMDLMLPAFSTFIYLDARSSAAIPAAVIARTQILASPALLNSYTYLSPPSYVLAPLAVSEIYSIALLRQGLDPWLETFPRSQKVVGGNVGSWEDYERRLAQKNGDVWRSMLARTSRPRGISANARAQVEERLQVMQVDE